MNAPRPEPATPVSRQPAGQLVGYARVSTIDQNLDRQIEAIGTVDKLFCEKQSGKNRGQRPILDECLAYTRAGDTLRVASLDRLARSLRDLRDLVDEFTGKGVTVHFLKENLIYTPTGRNPTSDLMLNLLGAFAEFERSLIHERQAEGIALAKKAGRYRGRTPKLTTEQVAQARADINAGIPKTIIAKRLHINRSTLYHSLHSTT